MSLLFHAVQLMFLWVVVIFLAYWVYSLQEKLKEQDELINKMVEVMGKIVDRV